MMNQEHLSPYIDHEQTMTQPEPALPVEPSPPAVSGPPASRWARLLTETVYLLVSFPLATAAFCVLLSMFVAGLGTAIIWVGVPLLGGTLLVAGVFAALERRMVGDVTGRPIPAPTYRPTGSFFFGALRDPQRWFDLMWGLGGFFVATVTFSLALVWLAGAASLLVGPLVQIVLRRAMDDVSGLSELLGFSGLGAAILVDIAAGAVFLITLPFVIHALAVLQSTVSRTLLGLRTGYEVQIEALRDSRQAAQEAEARSLRRLEQDIHDGPQQRLIRLQLDLARAERMAETDPERARLILSQAKLQTADTLAELRNLSRGIAPPVLVDRGLDAALDELAARSEVPTTVDSHTMDLPHQTATTAYFVVAETLTNVNKHAGAGHAHIRVVQHPNLLQVSVSDNGCGGASVAKGHGLAGLAERVRSVEGQFEVSSPSGGPTVVQADLPMGSQRVEAQVPCGS